MIELMSNILKNKACLVFSVTARTPGSIHLYLRKEKEVTSVLHFDEGQKFFEYDET